MKPPSLARWVLTRTLTGAARSAIIGDLDEEFTTSVLPRLGPRRARRWYWRQAIRSVMDHRLERPLGWRDRAYPPTVRMRDAIRQEREMVMSDLRHATRTLVRQPGFTAIVVLTLALGFGANIAVFSAANAWLFKPLPVPARDRLVSLRHQGGGGEFPYHVYLGLRDHAPVFDHLAAYADLPLTLRDNERMDRVTGELVSGTYFDTLGVPAALGRTIGPTDDRPGVAGAVVISDRLWRRRFDADPSIVGRTIQLNGLQCAVVGVTAASFLGLQVGQSPDLWLPLQLEGSFFPDGSALRRRTFWWLKIVGTVRPGVSTAAATAAALRAFQRDHPDERVFLEPTDRFARQQIVSTPIILLQGLSLSILLICCVNVTSLLLARSTTRQRELALCGSLGAGRARLVRQALVEGGTLVGAGCLLGAVVALPLASAAVRLVPGQMPSSVDVSVDHRVLLFALLLALITGLGVSLAPALRAARTDLLPFLKNSSPSDGPRRGGIAGLRWFLVPTQIALSAFLLVMAGLLARSLHNLQAIGARVEPERVLVADVSPGDAGYTGERLVHFYNELWWRLAQVPGVTSVGLGVHSPLGGTSDWGGPLVVDDTNTHADIHVGRVTPGYFAATGMPVVTGRDFLASDRSGTLPVVAVNETFVRRFLREERPLGQRIRYADDATREIVAVVQDFGFLSLREAPPPALFVPIAQQPRPPRLTVHLRTIDDARTLVGALRDQVRLLDPDVGLTDIRTLAMQFDRRLGEERLVTTVAALFSGLALLLAAIGLYGLVSYAVARRTAEMGIRVALGATPAGIRRLVLRETLVVVSLGLALGVPLAWAGARLARSLLYGVTASDVVVFAITLITLLGTALLAAWLPAHRASRVDPVTALRAE
ncbi:MAG: ADOP family duplicated permease [Vicinamibacteraceae bacterium]